MSDTSGTGASSQTEGSLVSDRARLCCTRQPFVVAAVLACAVVLLARPVRSQNASVLMPEGLHVWEFPSSSAARFSLVVLVDVGARDEVSGKTGLAHLVEHCIFRSTSRQSTQALLDGMREHHVSLNG